VADQRHLSGSMQLWDIDFLRSVQDWELELMTTFMEPSVFHSGEQGFC
jgi:hypothetical protein